MEAIWALSNATAIASPQQFGQMVDKGLIKALADCLKVNKLVDQTTIDASLQLRVVTSCQIGEHPTNLFSDASLGMMKSLLESLKQTSIYELLSLVIITCCEVSNGSDHRNLN